ncbi:hypothetical protein [Ancylobacter lacus]|uniref:hypothetical protein n=1 Tax=Ancylobacter lacus TaxID=2579970 RepID=UPI001BCC2148|nr:hypothetical protein [Ancylobacter lacus]MBS7540227.1 hypothetical protein [Ancylobacter lacus]
MEGAARLNGTLATSFVGPQSLQKSYTLVTASDGITGTFATFDTEGLPSFFTSSLDYSSNAVSMSLASAISAVPGLTANESALASAIDGALNNASGSAIGELPSGLSAFYDLSLSEVPSALNALSGQAYASEQSVPIGDSSYSRQAVLGRLRQSAYAGETGPVGALAFGGPATVQPGSGSPEPAGAAEALAYATKAPVAPAPVATTEGPIFWAEGFGGLKSNDQKRRRRPGRPGRRLFVSFHR